MNKLKISKEISLPLDVVTQTIAILAKRRAGKSYTMRRLAEQLLEAGEQIILIDPKGDQWGIRSSADGKSPGFPIIILGGEHGDAPLEVNSGEVVAKLVVQERVSVLIDLSTFRKHEIATFMAIFLENIYRLKAQERFRTPVMLIIDEADAIAPQKPQKGEERMLGAAEDIVRRGGQRGIGCALITQRSAVLNKNVLTQAQMLIVLRTIAPQDLAAMKAWIDVHGTLEQGKMLMDSLPSLPIGDAWFWSPGWPTAEGIFARSHILPITTFDSAATPKPGERKITPKNLADVDMESLKKQMAATIEKAKNDDPKLLKKRIIELENELKKTPSVLPTSVNNEKVISTAVQLALREQEVKFWQERDEWLKQIDNWFNILQNIGKSITDWKKENSKTKIYKNEYKHIPKIEPRKFIPGIVITPMEITGSEKILSKGANAILSYLRSVYPNEKTKAQLWIATGYSPGGGFNNLIYELNGLIEKTIKGYKGDYGSREFEASLDLWKNKLGLGPRRIFEHMLNNPYESHSKEELAEATGYAIGGGFNNNIYELTGPELIKKTSTGYIINPEILDL